MPAKRDQWQTISLKPLVGILDVRSRPADIPPGGFRWRQNHSTTSEGKLCRRDGFARAWSDFLYDNTGVLLSDPNHPGTGVYSHNHDLHHQGATREPVTFQFESTDSDGKRRLFAGTKSRIYVLDEPTGYWTTIASGYGAGDSYWVGAELQDTMIFCNGINDVLYHTLGTNTTQTIPDLMALGITAVRTCIEFQGFIFLMNFTQGGVRKMSRVKWSDLNLPLSYDPATIGSIAGFQDLDYGDEILGATPMGGALYIFTRRSIWRVTVAGTTNSTWTFTRVYNEPKNQTGCLLYPRTLVNTGTEVRYMSRDSIYRFDPYLAKPERDDWSRRADGVIYKKADTALSGVLCNAPCGEYRPGPREVWFSWPSGNRIINNWTLVLNIEQQAADVVDAGFTSFVNYRRTPVLGLCNEIQDFLAGSGTDWAIKSMGGVFYREFITPVNNDLTQDIDLDSPPAVYYTQGYFSILRGLIPTGFYDREKTVRNVLLDVDVSDQNTPCYLKLRLGNAYNSVDPNDQDDHCAPQWRTFPLLPMSCPDEYTIPTMTARNLKPSKGIEWRVLEQNRFLFFEVTVQQQNGTPAIGGDACFERLDFDCQARPKP